MKSSQFALIVALLLPFGAHALSESRPAKQSSSKSSSYKGGFSSQKSAPARSKEARPAPSEGKPSFGSFGSFGSRQPAAAPRPAPSYGDDAALERPKGGFGSFGGARGAEAPAKSGSALSRELERKSAKENALRTLDERRAAAAAPPPLPPLNPVLPPDQRQTHNQRQQYEQQQPYNQRQPSYKQQQPYNQQQAPVVVQQGNGLGAAMAGVVLGRAMGGGASHAGTATGSVATAGTAALPPAAPQPSFGASMLRTFVWLAVLGALGWLIYFGVQRFKRGGARSGANYSFERE